MEVAEVVKTTNKGGTALLTPFANVKLVKGFFICANKQSQVPVCRPICLHERLAVQGIDE